MDRPFGNAVVRIAPPDAHIIATGDLDLATTPALSAQISDALASGCQQFVVDLEGVTFCDASTVGVLVGLERRLRAEGGSLRIASASRPVRRVFGLVGLEGMLDPLPEPVSVSS